MIADDREAPGMLSISDLGLADVSADGCHGGLTGKNGGVARSFSCSRTSIQSLASEIQGKSEWLLQTGHKEKEQKKVRVPSIRFH